MSHEMPEFHPSEENSQDAEKKAWTEQRNKYIIEAFRAVIKKKMPLFSSGETTLGSLAFLTNKELYLKSELIGGVVPGGPNGGLNQVSENHNAFYKEFPEEIIEKEICNFLRLNPSEIPQGTLQDYVLPWAKIKEHL